ncbi:opioid growth factor receptor-related protein [Ralstonia pseudosolanacearum]|uniref:opioid growth factor receptor-related protein n=1 Tax=Ralstonia pseudosolanacearum TaxID=1310165 RepID=UPI00201DBCBA|nr:opioid growth factor receptor-related protein [Ralstonia pseudosolanacearum]UQY83679.1 hypothetical protein JNO62_06045 [Ralstonia pseudosolanacearum]
MHLTVLTRLASDLITNIDGGKTVSVADVSKQIEAGRVFEFLQRTLDPLDLSMVSDAVQIELTSEWRGRASAHGRMGIANNGLCLVLAHVVESIQQRRPQARTSLVVLRDFLAGVGTTNRGRTLADILAYTPRQFEDDHEFIQWVFPLTEPSQFNPHAPVMTDADCAELSADPAVRDGLQCAFSFVLKNYGATWDGGTVSQLAGGDARLILVRPSHHDRRVSRVLHSLTLLGMQGEARALLAYLERSYPNSGALRWWRAAVRDRN